MQLADPRPSAVAPPTPRSSTSAAVPLAGRMDVARLVHGHVAQAVERRLSAMQPDALAAWLDNTDDAALQGLARVYVEACERTDRWCQALEVLARHLDVPRLARAAGCFGFARMHLALLLASPAKESAFLQQADLGSRGPAPWPALRAHGSGVCGSVQP